eukprot:g28702.t1
MAADQKVLSFVAYRAQMLYKIVSESTFGLTDVEEATLGSVDTVDQVDGCAGEPLSNVEGLFCALDGVTRFGDGEVKDGEEGIRDGPGELKVGVKGVSKVDELFKLLMGTRGSIDTVID